MDGSYGVAAATSRWEPTFSDFLNEQLQGNLSCEFTMMPYAEPIDLLSAVQAGQLDFVFVNPSLHECLQVRGLCTAQCGVPHLYCSHSASRSSVLVQRLSALSCTFQHEKCPGAGLEHLGMWGSLVPTVTGAACMFLQVQNVGDGVHQVLHTSGWSA